MELSKWQSRIDPRGVLGILVGVLFCTLLSSTISLAQQDSVRYEPKLGHYLYYQRDSTGQWVLRQVWDAQTFLKHRARKIGRTDYTIGKRPSAPSKGKSGLFLSTNGTMSLSLSETRITDDNPALNSMMRRRSFLDVVQQSNISVLAKYGDHLRLDLQYNTETSIEAQRTRLTLQYEGDEFDFIQRLEAGNIRMDSYNPLIDVGRDLFGLMGVFKAGPLELKVLASRQHDSERKVLIRGGQQVRHFELRGSKYDFGKHFFLSEYFARRYDEALSTLPLVQSDLHIDRVEVWVSSTTQFTQRSDTQPVEAFFSPSVVSDSPPDAGMLSGTAVSIPRAVRLPESAYTLNPTLGYISLHAPLAEDQVLAVAYSYRLEDRTYLVGTFSAEGGQVAAALIAERNKGPENPLWGLMMKNAYALPGAGSGLTPEDLSAQILYRNARTNLDEHTITEGALAGKNWSHVFGWDMTNSTGMGERPDGLFDFVEDATISTRSGTLFIPQREPFVTIPLKVNGGATSPYAPFALLYSGSQTEAERATAEDRFVLRGSMRSSSAQVTNLGSIHLLPGSVSAKQGGRVLQEGIDYEVNYSSGDFTLRAHVQGEVEVTIRERELARSKEKNIVGTEANFSLLPGLSIGGTVMNYSEQSRMTRVRLGEEPLNNLLWGLHANYKKTSVEWTDKLREWTHLDLSDPSSLEVHASYASLRSKYNTPEGRITLEGFEENGMMVDLTFAKAWRLGADPTKVNASSPEGRRALMAWYMIDPLLVRDGAHHQPTHLRENPMERAHPLVREVRLSELLPQRDASPYLSNDLPTLSISYYPDERGPYNTSTEYLRADGRMDRPQEMWGSMTRPIEVHDFEKERIAYLEGWLLDPTEYTSAPNPGVLWIDLGQISEDVLPDHRIAAEGTMPMSDALFGRVPTELPQTYAFERTGSTPLEQQDKGLNGLTSDEERSFELYSQYLKRIEEKSSFGRWEENGVAKPGHPFRDPAGDDYHFFLGEEWDRLRAGILERYKYINGTEGNTLDREVQGLQSAQTWEPDVEDIDRDFVLQEEEHFFRYALPITPDGLRVDGDRIVAERIITHQMPDGSTMRSRWVKVRIPLQQPTSRFGVPRWQDIRSIRLSMTGFESPVHLRWALLRLVAMPWSPFEASIDTEDRRTAKLSVSTIGVEEESAKEPIPYVTPPSIERNQMVSSAFAREDEKALALSIQDLETGQAVTVYQSVNYDLRHYKELSLYSHLESKRPLPTGSVELFIRLGSDFTENYYEYRIPLEQTTAQDFDGLSTAQLQALVWPKTNHLQVSLERFTTLKQERIANGATSNQLFTRPDVAHPSATIGIKGYPTLGDVSSVMIGVRSRDRLPLSAEVWVNELSVSGAEKVGGDALLLSGRAVVSDLLSVESDGGYRSAGFGGLQSDVRKSELSNTRHFNLNSRLQLGKLLPQSWGLHAPITYTISFQKATPKFDPYASDLLYSETSSLSAGNMSRTERWTLPDWHFEKGQGVLPKSSRFFSLSNLRFSYDTQRTTEQSPEVASRFLRTANTHLGYRYEPKSGDYIQFSSDWNRQYLFTRYHKDQQTGGAFAGRWDWRRALGLRWAPLTWMNVDFESSTTALIHEPFEDEYHRSGQPQFRVLTREILCSILELGSTMNTNTRTQFTLNLPHFDQKVLAPLSASLTWRGHYSWTRGASTAQSFGGHRVTNSGYFDLHTGYRFRELYTKQDKGFLQQLSLHFRHTYGSSIPSFIPEAGKVMGIGAYQRSMAPTLWYMLAIGSNERHIRKAYARKWLLSEQSPLFRRPTLYTRDEAEGQLVLAPIPGLQIELSGQYLHHRHTTIRPTTAGLEKQVTGTLRLSTIGLRHFMERPLKSDTYHSKMFDRLVRMTESDLPLPEAFVRAYTLTGKMEQSLPSIATLLPNWTIRYDFTQAFPKVGNILQRLTLKNSYRGYIELPNYRSEKGAPDAAPIPQPHSIVQMDEMSPLAGIEATFKFGLELEERYTRRRTTTLLTSTARLLEQYDSEVYSSLRYRHAFPALFHSQLPLLRSTEHEVRVHLNHIYSQSYLLTHNLGTLFTAPSQGMVSHTLNTSVEYGLSKHITLRAFFEQEQRRPLVSNLTYPYRRTTYGLLLLLHLTP